MEVKKILFVTNLQTTAYNLIQKLKGLKQVGLEEVILCSSVFSADLRQAFLELEIDLKAIEESHALKKYLLDVTRQENISLVVANLENEQASIFKSSVAKKLVRDTPVPLLLAYDNNKSMAGSASRGIFDSVILATSWSESSRRALDYIISLKKIVGVLDIVNVLNEKPTVKDIRELKEKTQHIRKICLDEQLDAESHIYAGKTPEEIALAAKDYDSTIIVMGMGARNSVRKKFFSPLPCRVAGQAHVPVLIIP